MDRKKILNIISSGHAATHWYLGLINIMLPVIVKEIKLNYTQVGIMFSTRSALGIGTNTVVGVISDRIRKRSIILGIGLIFSSLFYSGIGFANSFLLLLVFFVCANLSDQVAHPPGMAILSEHYPDRRGYVLGIHGAYGNIGESLSPLIIGFLLYYLHWRIIMHINVLPGVIAGFLLIIMIKEKRDSSLPFKKSVFIRSFKSEILKNPPIIGLLFISSLRTSGQQCLSTFLPLYLAHNLKLSSGRIGFYLSILTLVGGILGPAVGEISDRIGRKPVIFMGMFFSGLLIFMIAGFNLGWFIIPVLILLGIFHYALRPILFAFAMDVTPAEMSATIVGVIFTFNQGFSAISSLIAGYIADVYGLIIAFFFLGILTLTGGLIVLILPKKKKVSGKSMDES